MAPNVKEKQAVRLVLYVYVLTHLFQFVKPVSSASFHLTLSQRVANVILPQFVFSLSSTALCLPDLVPHLSTLFPLQLQLMKGCVFLGPSYSPIPSPPWFLKNITA